MLSHGICIMSMVHRQRAVLLQFPLVIYLAALLKCSCCWHWLTNQTVKAHPEYQKKYCFKISVLPSAFWTMSCTNQVAAIDFFFFFCGVQVQDFSSKVSNLKVRPLCLTGQQAALSFPWSSKTNIPSKSCPYINLSFVLISELVSISV